MQVIEKDSKTFYIKSPSKRYRDRNGIAFCILKTVRDHGNISHSKIRYTAYGVGQGFEDATKELFDKGLLEHVEEYEKNHLKKRAIVTTKVRITEKGRRLLSLMEEVLRTYLPNEFLQWDIVRYTTTTTTKDSTF